MTEEWKKEQELVIQLESENQALHEELSQSKRANSGLKNMIEALKSDNTSYKNQIENENSKKDSQRSRNQVDTITFGLQKIEELDHLLLARTERFEDCRERLEFAK